jgi:exosortase E/protease (VPEID-CTERM system)
MRNAPALPIRLIALAALYAVEFLAISIRADTSLMARHGGLLAALHPGHIWRALVAFVTFSLTFGLITARGAFQRISREMTGTPIDWRLIGGHLCSILAFAFLSHRLDASVNPGRTLDWVGFFWITTGTLAIMLAWIAVIPWTVCRELLASARGVWILAAAGAVLAVAVEDFRPLLWGRMIGLTLDLVQIFLRPLVPDLVVNRSTGMFASHRFQLIVTPECAGFEGAGLMLVFTAAWLVMFRKECRFPRVLLLIPASVALAWLLNSVRLAALFWIGHTGAPGIALGGFHSQAGWIAFSGAALGFTLVLHRVPGLTKTAGAPSLKSRSVENPAAWYLMPFLAILATSMITRAASDGFEWLYPLRLLAAALVLWHYRRRYATLDWRFGWASALAGSLVFLMWLVLDWKLPSVRGTPLASGLAALPPVPRTAWLVCRVAAASLTVPVAEELAFRGCLLRRLVSRDFVKVERSALTFFAVLVSSLAFGMLHGNRWIAGTCAGLAYAWSFRYRGRIGDAVAAHAITNALLAAWVLVTGSWNLW